MARLDPSDSLDENAPEADHAEETPHQIHPPHALASSGEEKVEKLALRGIDLRTIGDFVAGSSYHLLHCRRC